MPSEHSKYGDGSFLAFRVEDTLFQVPVRQLKQSKYFLSMIDEMSTVPESAAGNSTSPIFLSEVSSVEMESFLTVLGASFLFGDPNLSFSQWAAALRLATTWSFEDIRGRITAYMENILHTADPFERIDASLKCRVEKWLHPAYEALCSRASGLTEDEAEQLGFRRATAIWRIREALRSYPVAQSPNTNWGKPGKGSKRPTSTSVANHNVLALVKKEEALKYS